MEKVKFTNKIVAMQPELQSFALKLTQDQDSANDLVQDCILKAFDNAHKFIHAENFKGWMYTIMRNLFINNYRRSVRELSFIDAGFAEYAHNQVAHDERFEEIYDLKLLHKTIKELPEDIRKPFMMFVAGMKYKEIAEKMDLPIGTIKSRMFFARKRLKNDLKDFS
ncbi:sigma-70 family RNA polymerase sigma factor [Bacteroidaceae bacterium]|jgi:RNA polymerase sigma-70 factor (ECF subfamily)|nr:sigma-70 family RNA polymerase sigma factor [Bacteroides sp.]